MTQTPSYLRSVLRFLISGPFRALKGASNNLDIITRIDLPLIPNGTIWVGFLATPTAYRTQVFSFFANLTNSSNYDPYAALIDTNVFSNGSWHTLLHMAYTKPDVVNPPTFAPLIALPSFYNTLRSATQGNLTEFEAGSPAQSRALLATMTQKNDAAFMGTFSQLANATTRSRIWTTECRYAKEYDQSQLFQVGVLGGFKLSE